MSKLMPKAYVIGLGKSGIAAARLLQKKGSQVIVYDSAYSPSLESIKKTLTAEGITVQLGTMPTLEQERPALVVVSPGVPWDIPWLMAARDRGWETIGELELAWRHLQSLPWVGVTGTNGKTTTTALIAAIFAQAGIKAPACGNIGYAACELALSTPPEWVIAEISSFQIESSKYLAPQIGVWTTFSPDHLNRHHTLENYYQIKASLLQRSQKKVINADDPYLAQILGQVDWQRVYWTSIRGKEKLIGPVSRGVYIENGQVIAFGQPILPLSCFQMMGLHNLQNLLMAVAVARLANIEAEAIQRAVSQFSGVPHRLELIAEVNQIKFINDSKATNYDAATVGLTSVAAPIILIAGGEAKSGDDQAWLNLIRQKVAYTLLIGACASNFAQRLEAVGYQNYQVVETMEKAVSQSLELAQAKKASVVLLSPACASFDQYRNFEERGDHFRQLCQSLLSDLAKST